MSLPSYYITTPIYYVNDVPHIGHAYTTLACDAMARFKRLDGYQVLFLTGTDEHGQKVENAANDRGLAPKEFTDQVSQNFRDLLPILNVSNDDFIRTTEKRHKVSAQRIWQKLMDNGHIYLDKYSGWYSLRDEAYFTENELIDGKAPTGATVEWVEEESYFFDLSAWQEPLLEFYEKNPKFIAPRSRRNEVISFVKSGLRDLSISRTSFNWGISVPNDPKHIMYVWLDALTNYITAAGFPEENIPKYNQFWPADLHMVGKDILRFHAVYWPAFLMAAELELPKRVFAHGWWTNEGEKISKSIGNVIDPIELIQTFGLDQVRYFLLREVPFGNDGDFSQQSMIARINSDLSNDLGNLCQRVLSFVYKNGGQKIPQPMNELPEDQRLLQSAKDLIAKLREHFDSQEFNLALEKIWTVIGAANKYIDTQAPWALKKSNPERMNTVLYNLIEVLRYLAITTQPIIPKSANIMLDQLTVPANERSFKYLTSTYKIKPGEKLEKPSPIFPRFVVDAP
ncbi:methionine--tRNA ligase [Alphaproteobacteria bacterium]|nr:methionine--tRNA ligase [Alphaproteobacteria bacterium]